MKKGGKMNFITRLFTGMQVNDAVNMRGGMIAWSRANLPVSKGN
jgi:hypothetical protein